MEALEALVGVSVLVFVLSSMLAMGFGLTVPQILEPLRNWKLMLIALEVLPPSLRPNEKGQLHRGGRRPTPPRDGTLNTDFGWLSSVFNWARKRKEGGRRLLRENPLHDVTWPREQNIRRPVARHERYLATLGHVDTVDPEGRLRCIVSLARFTGRRESAICNPRASDLLLSGRRIFRVPRLKPYRQGYARTLIHMFTEAWGADLRVCDVDQSRVDTYVAKRRALEVLPPSFRPNEKGQLHRGGRRPTPPPKATLGP